jgi:hypothetical protein
VLIIGLIIAGLVILTGLIIAGVMLGGAWAATRAFPEAEQRPVEPAGTRLARVGNAARGPIRSVGRRGARA